MKTPLSRLQTQRLTQTHAQPNSRLQEGVFRQPFSLKLFLFDIVRFSRIVRGEVRSCYGRICVLRDSRIRWGRAGSREGLDLGPLFVSGSDGHLEYSTEPLARSTGIESISAKYPWLNDGDDLLILEGWELGKQFALGNVCSSRMDTAEP